MREPVCEMIPCSRKWIDAEDVEAVAQAARSLGRDPEARREAYERDFALALGAAHAVSVTSAAGAMHLACLAAGLQPGAEVILSPISPARTANAALLCGARPVFADVSFDTSNLCPESVARLITPRTRAIIATDFGGHPADLPALRRIAVQCGALLIEDGSQALGSRTPDGQVGDCRQADMTVFSSAPADALSLGGGGFVTTNRADLARRLRLAAGRPRYQAERLGDDWREQVALCGLDLQPGELQCALGHSQLRKLGRITARNRAAAGRYDAAFSGFAAVETPIARPGYQPARGRYVVRLPGVTLSDRRQVYDRLHAELVGADVHHIPVYWQQYYQVRYGYAPGLCPVAERHYRETLTLPLFPTLTDSEIDHVVAAALAAAADLDVPQRLAA